MKNRFYILIYASVLGIIWTLYLLYCKKGYLSKTDYIIIGIIIIFITALLCYFKRKLKK